MYLSPPHSSLKDHIGGNLMQISIKDLKTLSTTDLLRTYRDEKWTEVKEECLRLLAEKEIDATQNLSTVQRIIQDIIPKIQEFNTKHVLPLWKLYLRTLNPLSNSESESGISLVIDYYSKTHGKSIPDDLFRMIFGILKKRIDLYWQIPILHEYITAQIDLSLNKIIQQVDSDSGQAKKMQIDSRTTLLPSQLHQMFELIMLAHDTHYLTSIRRYWEFCCDMIDNKYMEVDYYNRTHSSQPLEKRVTSGNLNLVPTTAIRDLAEIKMIIDRIGSTVGKLVSLSTLNNRLIDLMIELAPRLRTSLRKTEVKSDLIAVDETVMFDLQVNVHKKVFEAINVPDADDPFSQIEIFISSQGLGEMRGEKKISLSQLLRMRYNPDELLPLQLIFTRAQNMHGRVLISFYNKEIDQFVAHSAFIFEQNLIKK